MKLILNHFITDILNVLKYLFVSNAVLERKVNAYLRRILQIFCL